MLKYDIHFRLDGDTYRKLRTLADIQQRTMSNLIRWLISQEFLRQYLELHAEDETSLTSESSHLSNEEKGNRG